MRWLLALCLLLLPGAVLAQPAAEAAPLQFADTVEEARFHALVTELRCVMCQNQSLADSDALIAHELRREVLGLMRAGRDDREIKEFLAARYGDFVLYRPRVEGATWLLWFGPLLLLLAGGGLIAAIVRRRAAAVADVPRDDRQEW